MTTKSKSLDEISATVVASFNRYAAQGTTPWTWEQAVKDLPYQVGSIAKLTMQLNNERWADGKSAAEIKTILSNELADVIADTLFIAHGLDIDMNRAMAEMLDDDSRKVTQRTAK